MKKNILAVFAGYILFTIISMLYFGLTGLKPELMPETKTIIITGIVSGLGSLLSGYAAASISRSKTKVILVVLSGLIATISLISMFAQPDASHWTQLMALILLAPLAYLGGLVKLKQKNKNERVGNT